MIGKLSNILTYPIIFEYINIASDRFISISHIII